MPFSVVLDPKAITRIEQQLEGIVGASAGAGAIELQKSLSAGRRSGIWYGEEKARQGILDFEGFKGFINPRRSSAPGEFPQEQTGELVGAVSLGFIGTTSDQVFVHEVGVFNVDVDKLVTLEFAAPEDGGRPFVSKSMARTQTHREMRKVARMVDP